MKKPSVVSFLITLLLAAAVCIQGSEPVKDTAGNSLQPGKQYFIQPVQTGRYEGGGLVPSGIATFPTFCPLGITETRRRFEPGLPVSFASPLGVVEFVTTSSIVNIEFHSDDWPVCKEYSKLWKVDDSSSVPNMQAITIGGTQLAQNSQFKIEKAGTEANTYKFTSVTGAGTVGFTPQGFLQAPQIVLTNDNAKTLVVKFKKVDDATTASTSTSRIDKLAALRMFPFY
ncbi:hypothetical protein CARUB_v10020902mg [Capsella rubella]|uniref:Uncharacterized protein n=2 Tax=Capsella rubella TaxID=81985 RepID=R0GIX1_9BRAS|nr:hypothetical protein CARUB_v10020902mg [Capsella rubella]